MKRYFKTIAIIMAAILMINLVPVPSVSAALSEAADLADTTLSVDPADSSEPETASELAASLESAEQVDAANQLSDSTGETGDEVSVLYEVEELREEGMKHFRMSDGSYTAVAYGTPVHYQDEEGRWQDIDNSLAMSTDSNGVSTYQSVTPDTAVAFSASLTGGNLFTAAYGDVSVSMSLLDTSQSGGTANLNEDIVFSRNVVACRAEDTASALQLETNEKFDEFMPENLKSSLIYEDVYPDVDLLYTAYGYNIKEQIIVRERQNVYRYDFLLEMDGLTAALNTDGSVYLKDAEDMVIYEIPAPYMIDDAGRISTAAAYTLEETAQGTVLTVEADREWMNSEDRVFPVRIDPTLLLRPTNMSDSLYATFVDEIFPDTPQNYKTIVFTGGIESGGKFCRRRGFIYFTALPSLPVGSEVIDSRLSLFNLAYVYAGGIENQRTEIGIYEVTEDKPDTYATYEKWMAAISWNNQPAFDSSNAIDYVRPDYNYSLYHEWDISELVKKWYTEDVKNTTIAVIALGEKSMTVNSSMCLGFSITQFTPYFTVSYRNTMGIEPYYTYTNVDAGDAGTGYISDHTGQFKVVKEIVSYASAVNPFSLNLVYNSDYFSNTDADYQPPEKLGLSMKIGSGWTLDVIQTAVEETISDYEYIRYSDGDGTIHYFLKSSTEAYYYDEDGLGLKIRKMGDKAYRMSDKKDNLWLFSNGLLTCTMDNNWIMTDLAITQDGNQYIYNYTSDKKLSTIQQKNKGGSTITVATFAYNEDGYLTSVTDAAGIVTTFSYTGTDLTGITRQDCVMAEFTYADHRMTQLKDANQKYALNLEYTNGKVSRYYETGNGVRGQECSITYANMSKTIYHDYGEDGVEGNDDIYTSCLFDYAGRTTNIYSTEAPLSNGELTGNVLSASNAVYTVTRSVNSTSGTFRKNNRISRSSGMGIAGQQMIEDFGFEKGSANTEWTLEKQGGGNADTFAITTDNPRTGKYSLKGQSTSRSGCMEAERQTKVLTAGEEYTFSAYVNVPQMLTVSGGGIYLEVLYGSESLGKSNCLDYATYADIDKGWIRISVTFTAAANAAHTVRICGDRSYGTFYADDLQLEKGAAPSNTNLLENGDMSNSGKGWTIVSGGSYSMGALKLSGSPANENTKFYQDVPINLPGTESFVMSGWVKANAVPDDESVDDEYNYPRGSNRRCGLRAIIHYSDNTDEYHYVTFDADVADWQFASVALVPEETAKTIEYIRVMGTYEKNANSAYFDNLSLVREICQTMAYDNDGNLVSVTTTGLKEESDTYQNGNLIRSVTGGQGTYTYDYDDTFKFRLVKVTTESTGLNQSYSYDSMGNVTATTLAGGSTGTLKLQTSAAYSSDGNRLTSVTDGSGSTVSYTYGDTLSESLGMPTVTTDANGDQLHQTYDAFGRITEAAAYEAAGNSIAKAGQVNYTYSSGRLDSIRRGSSDANRQTYSFVYDGFGNVTDVKVGSQTLASYSYGGRNGQLRTLVYGNEESITYEYDRYGRLETEYHGTDAQRTYTYNGEGLLSAILETQGSQHTQYRFQYDSLGRLLYSEKFYDDVLSYRIANTYDDKNRQTDQSIQTDELNYAYRYTYADGDGSLTKLYIDMEGTDAGEHNITFGYDHLKRLQTVTNELYASTYTYEDRTDNTELTTSRIKKLAYSSEVDSPSFSYEYDAVGNIITYQDPNGTTTYEYDGLSQLTRATSGSTVYSYTYDEGGNILTASNGRTTHTYTYGDSNWKDLLTAYDGHEFSYDGVGNPLLYHNGTEWEMEWTVDRRLASAEDTDGRDVYYTYDLDGTRRSKTVDGVPHYYIWEDGRPIREYVQGNIEDYSYGDTLYFFYDQSGRPFALEYSGTRYYYILNAQGDVIYLMDALGTKVGSYIYDPYGKVIMEDGLIAYINPLRYRGYYYDYETGFYYLNGRYYDPEIGRFISADHTETLATGLANFAQYNLFAYCWNNPVNMSDESGTWPSWATKVVIGTAAIAIGVAVTALTGGAALPALVGSLKLAAVGTAIGAGAGATKHLIKEKTTEGIGTAILNGAATGYMVGGLVAGGMQVGRAALTKAGSGISLGKTKSVEMFYHTPSTKGGTIISVKKKLAVTQQTYRFRLDLDIVNGLHFHSGVGKAAKAHHRIISWLFK